MIEGRFHQLWGASSTTNRNIWLHRFKLIFIWATWCSLRFLPLSFYHRISGFRGFTFRIMTWNQKSHFILKLTKLKPNTLLQLWLENVQVHENFIVFIWYFFTIVWSSSMYAYCLNTQTLKTLKKNEQHRVQAQRLTHPRTGNQNVCNEKYDNQKKFSFLNDFFWHSFSLYMYSNGNQMKWACMGFMLLLYSIYTLYKTKLLSSSFSIICSNRMIFRVGKAIRMIVFIYFTRSNNFERESEREK